MNNNFEEFFNQMEAQRCFLTQAEMRTARAMLAEGFDAFEVEVFLQTSAWDAFYRHCVKHYRLPESEGIRDLLRESFEFDETKESAANRAMEALAAEHRLAETVAGSRTPPSALSVAFEIYLLGRERCCEKNWPAWMREMLDVDAPPSASE